MKLAAWEVQMHQRISRTAVPANITNTTIVDVREEEDADHKDPTQKPSIKTKD